jgi:hypothetical protein
MGKPGAAFKLMGALFGTAGGETRQNVAQVEI